MPLLSPLMMPLILGALLGPGPEPLPAPSPHRTVLQLPASPAARGTADLRLQENGSTYPVPAGLEVPLRIEGDLAAPPTDPGRTLIHFSLGAPEEGFRLGPGTQLDILDGGRATLTVARPLRVEAFGKP